MNDTQLEPLYNLIVTFEGFRASPYRCPAGVPTIGFGTTGPTITMDTPPLTRRVAYQIMCKDVAKLIPKILTLSPNLANHPNRLCAITDFVYNLGLHAYENSTLRTKIDNELYDQVPEQLRRWVHVGTNVLDGLVKRREAEIELFNTPDTP